ncbi:MAG TPA: DPP IV N-terminal domain-containing protein [Polyangiaceae bacterium]|nr:DPP IV N-terminal domain-containing protein [Polyangiaceae bacterium]
MLRHALCLLLVTACGGAAEEAGTVHESPRLASTKPRPTRLLDYAPAPETHLDEALIRALAETHSFRSGTPRNGVITPDGRAILFLRAEARKSAQALYKLDIATGRLMRLCGADEVYKNPNQLSAADRERRERLRQTATGFTSFELTPDGLAILLPLAGHLFVFDRMTGNVRELPVDGAFDPHLSPDGKRVAYVRENDVRILDMDGRSPEASLTRGGTEKVPHGMAEFIAQEEFDRERGFWFAPDGKHIAFEEADQTGVEALSIADPAHPEREPDRAYYPRAGKNNAVVRLGIVATQPLSPTTWVEWDRKKFPYVATVRWDDGAPLTLYVLDREQKTGQLLSVDEKTGKTRELLTEHDEAFLNVDTSVPRWTADGKSFVWSTERNGSWELEVREAYGNITAPRTLLAPGQGYRRVLDLDSDKKQVVVEESAEPSEQSVWVVPLAGGVPAQIGPSGGVVTGSFGKYHDSFVATVGTPTAYPRFEVLDTKGKQLAQLPSVAESPPWVPQLELRKVGGDSYRVAVVRPHGFVAGHKYPVIDAAYGGPGVNLVTADAVHFIRAQMMADATGAIVVSIDARGTPFRDRAWERAIAGKLASVPIEGHIEALRALGAQVPELDLSRVGVYGWSFGGFFAAAAVLSHPEMYKAAVAGAPPSDWHDYDTAYTERYLGLPSPLDPKGDAVYAQSSLIEMTAHAPVPRPLLLMHGTADDNVYFASSLKLAEALARANRPFTFIPLVGQTHLVADPARSAVEWEKTAEFLHDKLAAPHPAASQSAAPRPAGPSEPDSDRK